VLIIHVDTLVEKNLSRYIQQVIVVKLADACVRVLLTTFLGIQISLSPPFLTY